MTLDMKRVTVGMTRDTKREIKGMARATIKDEQPQIGEEIFLCKHPS
jgi:hypothetical protein